MKIRNLLIQGALGALIGAGALAASTSSASAAVACNRSGDCWHTQQRYNYHPSFGVTVHNDNWRWGNRDHNRWREHAGRGYWRNGIWLSF